MLDANKLNIRQIGQKIYYKNAIKQPNLEVCQCFFNEPGFKKALKAPYNVRVLNLQTRVGKGSAPIFLCAVKMHSDVGY